MGKTEARALSDALFHRLAELAPGTHAYSYVRGTIIELNMALVRFVAGRYRHRCEDMEDIVQAGTIGLIKAVDGYDCERGVEFATYAIPTISGELKRFFRDTSWRIRVPRSMQELYFMVVHGSDRLEQEFGRPPTPQEVAEALGLTPEQVTAGLVAGQLHRSTSLDALREDGSEEIGSAILDRIGECDERLELVVSREAVRPLLRELRPRERTILLLRFWGDRTQAEIAEQIGVSQMQVSRLLAATLSQLRERLEAPATNGG
ncbi:SigB/SigF/SigG family RNA polymerase sigma factor [Kitasatospora purpeofusca]|uniref:SigB/SigF/SigG family RNA polymerase sigma factor n=1 Tax=Kitasatospora purpeofusca TaxID=67352 RepID=UPI002A5A0F27|nr:SigB/SigF/SigG family RNA polymerase sigma factor [Kitasatospora purpeofusca]MDY0811352.1 SigB/SigF/SigG family RNA polymerase sigma factor [Kitasatospora purpeofusca]